MLTLDHLLSIRGRKPTRTRCAVRAILMVSAPYLSDGAFTAVLHLSLRGTHCGTSRQPRACSSPAVGPGTICRAGPGTPMPSYSTRASSCLPRLPVPRYNRNHTPEQLVCLHRSLQIFVIGRWNSHGWPSGTPHRRRWAAGDPDTPRRPGCAIRVRKHRVGRVARREGCRAGTSWPGCCSGRARSQDRWACPARGLPRRRVKLMPRGPPPAAFQAQAAERDLRRG